MLKQLILSLMFNFAVSAYAFSDDALNQITANYKADLGLGSVTESLKEIKLWKSTAQVRGKWLDIDYNDTESTDFKPFKSLIRADAFARAYVTKGHPYLKDEILRKMAVISVKNWINNDYESYNWWNNEIGVQQYMLATLLNFSQDFSANELKLARSILDRSSLTGGKANHTAQNQLWLADIVFARGILFGVADDVSDSLKEVMKQVSINNDEGIQNDGAFFQHGPLIYNGGYGLKFARVLARFASYTAGTSQTFSKNQYSVLDHFLLDGTRLLMRNGNFDIGVTGREMSRSVYFTESKSIILRILKLMSASESPRKQEYEAWKASLKSQKPIALGSKIFASADLMTYQTPLYYASARMVSTRTLNTDSPSNSEGLLSHNIADGSMMVMKTGSEYKSILPVWEWNMIPGTTSSTQPLVPARFVPGVESGENMRTMGVTDFVGGTSNGNVGVAGIDFFKANVRYHLSAKKSWFFLEGGVIALGSDIHCHDCGGVVTTLEQSEGHGKVIRLKNGGFWHNKIAYVPIGPNIILGQLKLQSGSWNAINANESKEKISLPVFKAWILHQEVPAGANYAYAVVPGIAEKVAENAVNVFSSLQTVANGNVHAVWDPNNHTLLAIFFRKGTLKLGGHQITTDKGIALILNFKNKMVLLTSADPSQLELQSAVKIDQLPPVTVHFPQGKGQTGTSTQITL